MWRPGIGSGGRSQQASSDCLALPKIEPHSDLCLCPEHDRRCETCALTACFDFCEYARTMLLLIDLSLDLRNRNNYDDVSNVNYMGLKAAMVYSLPRFHVT